MAMAVAALKRKEVVASSSRAPWWKRGGEPRLSAPGTLSPRRWIPYIRPLYDALFDMADMERATQLVESGVIEIAPLAFI